MEFTSAEVHRLAQLSRLQLEVSETETFRVQLGSIFGLIDALQAVNTQDIAPLSHPLDVIAPMTQRLRDDQLTETNQRAANMANAPQAENGLFLVPKVIE